MVSRGVTWCHVESHGVTWCHVESHGGRGCAVQLTSPDNVHRNRSAVFALIENLRDESVRVRYSPARKAIGRRCAREREGEGEGGRERDGEGGREREETGGGRERDCERERRKDRKQTDKRKAKTSNRAKPPTQTLPLARRKAA